MAPLGHKGLIPLISIAIPYSIRDAFKFPSMYIYTNKRLVLIYDRLTYVGV